MQLSRNASLVTMVAVILLTRAAWGAVPTACAPPPGFRDTPHPTIAPIDQLVSHTEEVIVNRPLDAVLAEAERTTLNQAIRKSDSLPGVSGTYDLTSDGAGRPGSRRLVCLTDGSTTEAEILANDRDKNSAQFRYVVWNYTTEKARPILYGVGHFVRTDLGDGRTRVRWTYSFQLNRRRFPGDLGSLGDFLFRVGFLDREYAQMMRRTLGKE
jgi:hypothetical protein